MKSATSISKYFALIVGATSIVTAGRAMAQLPSFNGAEGFGGTFNATTDDPMPAGGWLSNASVYHVTTNQDLMDASNHPVQGNVARRFLRLHQPKLAETA